MRYCQCPTNRTPEQTFWPNFLVRGPKRVSDIMISVIFDSLPSIADGHINGKAIFRCRLRIRLHILAFVIAFSILLFSIVLRYCSVSQMPNDASVLAFDMPFLAKESLFWYFKSNKEKKTKRKTNIFDFFKCLHVFFSLFSILYKICKLYRSSRLWQAVRGLMTEFLERFLSFHCLNCQTWM